jgi:hypothetical protein
MTIERVIFDRNGKLVADPGVLWYHGNSKEIKNIDTLEFCQLLNIERFIKAKFRATVPVYLPFFFTTN